VQASVLPEEARWHQKAFSVDSSLINFGSKQENPEIVKNLASGFGFADHCARL